MNMISKKSHLAACLISTLWMTASQADNTLLEVRFAESAPKDSFIFKNLSSCTMDSLQITVDLSDSAGKLIFDTTETGAGVEVFQPFETRKGNISLMSAATVNDGDKQLTVQINGLGPEQSASFTIDVDDTMTNSALGNIRVSNSEIASATVSVVHDQSVSEGTFGSDSIALVNLPDCQ